MTPASVNTTAEVTKSLNRCITKVQRSSYGAEPNERLHTPFSTEKWWTIKFMVWSDTEKGYVVSDTTVVTTITAFGCVFYSTEGQVLAKNWSIARERGSIKYSITLEQTHAEHPDFL